MVWERPDIADLRNATQLLCRQPLQHLDHELGRQIVERCANGMEAIGHRRALALQRSGGGPKQPCSRQPCLSGRADWRRSRDSGFLGWIECLLLRDNVLAVPADDGIAL